MEEERAKQQEEQAHHAFSSDNKASHRVKGKATADVSVTDAFAFPHPLV
jgi:hypothetical protein